YAGASLWDWARLPDSINPRYSDYARANVSVGINGVVLTNVNANALILTPAYLVKVAALARVFRPYGITVSLTARLRAPLEIGARHAGRRRVRAARRRFPEECADSGEERAARLPAARAIPSVVRCDAAHAADDGSPDHQGVPGPGQPSRVPGTAVGGSPAGRHVRARPRLDGVEGDPGHRRRGHRRHRSRLDGLGLQPGQLVRVRPARLGPHAALGRHRGRVDPDDVLGR